MQGTPIHLIAALALLAPVPSVAADWPMYLYDLSHSSFASSETEIDASNVTTLQPAWTFNGLAFGGAPIIVGGVLYIGDWGGAFYAIKAGNGRLMWRQNAGMAAAPPDSNCQPAIGVTGQAVVKDGVVYVPGGDSAVYAFNRMTGSQLWRVPLADPASGSYIWSSLTLVNGSLYVGIASLGDCPLVQGGIARIDPSNPQTPFIKYLVPADNPDGGASVWSTAAIDPASNTLFATTGNGDQDAGSGTWGSAFLSMDAQSFEVKNYYFLPSVSKIDDDDWGSSPTLFQASDGTPLVAATAKDGILYCLRRKDMSVVWTTQLAAGCDDPQDGCGSLSTPAYDGNRLYVGAGQRDINSFDYGTVYSIDPSTGAKLWSQDVSKPVIAPVTVANGLVFASTGDGLMAFDAATGNKLWDDGGGDGLYSQPVVADGTVYAAYISGRLVAYRVANGPPPPPPVRHPTHR